MDGKRRFLCAGRGFCLLEVLPAMGLLMVVLALAGSLLAMMSRTREEAGRFGELEVLLSVASVHFASGGQGILLAVKSGGEQELPAFPDAGWLPDGPGRDGRKPVWLFSAEPLPGPGGEGWLMLKGAYWRPGTARNWNPLMLIAADATGPGGGADE
jgi:type II secretory pathway pseudopilin PulG